MSRLFAKLLRSTISDFEDTKLPVKKVIKIGTPIIVVSTVGLIVFRILNAVTDGATYEFTSGIALTISEGIPQTMKYVMSGFFAYFIPLILIVLGTAGCVNPEKARARKWKNVTEEEKQAIIRKTKIGSPILLILGLLLAAGLTIIIITRHNQGLI